MISIVDYESGNVRAIQNILRRCGAASTITSDPREIFKSSAVILPGVGNFSACATKLDQSGLRQVLVESAVDRKLPLLGICLGMQLLFESSEEDVNGGQGLGLLKGRGVKFREFDNAVIRIPNMGWRGVRQTMQGSRIFGEAPYRFYFTHSFHAPLDAMEISIFNATNGYEFPAGVASGNVMGVQFHPEKSHVNGIRFFERYLSWVDSYHERK